MRWHASKTLPDIEQSHSWYSALWEKPKLQFHVFAYLFYRRQQIWHQPRWQETSHNLVRVVTLRRLALGNFSHTLTALSLLRRCPEQILLQNVRDQVEARVQIPRLQAGGRWWLRWRWGGRYHGMKQIVQTVTQYVELQKNHRKRKKSEMKKTTNIRFRTYWEKLLCDRTTPTQIVEKYSHFPQVLYCCLYTYFYNVYM